MRCSTRLRRDNDGFRQVRIEKEPSKHYKNWLIEIDEVTGKPGPISLSTLQDKGIKCGVDPKDLTEDVLLQAPSPMEPIKEDDE